MFDKEYLYKIIKELFAIDSPSGFTINAIQKIKEYTEELGYNFTTTKKGNAIIKINSNKKSEKTMGLTAHVDTLGLMVRSINENGTLEVVAIGGPLIPTLDGEYCKIITRENRVFTGTILSKSPAAHVYPDATTLPRTLENMCIRIDEVVKSREDVEKLNIGTGDFVCIDTKTTITEADFIKSRFLDDKLSVCIIFTILKYLKDNKIELKCNLNIYISTYEEVGHGMSFIGDELDELLAIDMGCIGLDLNCTEFDVSICAKDSSGPYDFQLTNKLIKLAKDNNLNYAVDIYPKYSSDVSAARNSGNDFKGALIGPGVQASHGMERSHYKGVLNTMELIMLYLTIPK